MTARKGFKRHVRDRSRKTGESYTAALAHLRHRLEQEQPVSRPATSDADSNRALPTYGPVIVVSGPGGVGKSTIAHLVAAAFERSVHLNTDDLMASVVSGWVDPNLPEAEHQNAAIGGVVAVSAMGFANDGYTTVVDGYLFPDGVVGLAAGAGAEGCLATTPYSPPTSIRAGPERVPKARNVGRLSSSHSRSCIPDSASSTWMTGT